MGGKKIKKRESLDSLGESLMVQHTGNWGPIRRREKLAWHKYLKCEEITGFILSNSLKTYIYRVKNSSECKAE